MMAPPTSPAHPTVPTPQGPVNPSRSPLPLSASQESQVRELYHKRVRQKCADEVRGTSPPTTHRLVRPACSD